MVIYFLNLSLNAGISVFFSWIISSHYFRKESRTEKIADQIKYGLQQALMPIIYPQFFDNENSVEIRPRQASPSKRDIPHIELARVPKLPAVPGHRLEFLMKVLDFGMDLQNPGGISVIDHMGKNCGVVAVGLGYCRFSIMIDKDAKASPQEITVTLEDQGNRKNTQNLPFKIGKREP